MTIRTTIAALATTPLLLLAACGGGDSAPDAVQATGAQTTPGSSTGTATAGTETAEADTTGPTEESGTAAGAGLTAESFTGAVTAAQVEVSTAHLTSTMDMQGQSVTMDGDLSVGKTFTDTAMTVTLDMGTQGQMKMVLIDKVFYINMGPVTQNKFFKLDLNDPNNPLALLFNQIFANIDPTKSLDAMKGAITKFEEVGPETIGGDETTRYDVAVDTQKMMSAMGLSDMMGAAGGTLPTTLTYTMYIGANNLVRRMEMAMAGATTTMDFTKWGEPVKISAPPANQISQRDPFAALG